MSRITASTLVPIQHPTGLELTAQLTFEKKPTRLQVRLKTLQKYVEKYPTGWKKRLELADILYSLGQWNQAIEQYRLVVERQPHLLNVRLKLGKILQILHQTTDAIALYTDALQYTNDDDEATRHHFNGLLHECHKQVTEATQAYRHSTDLEPQNPAHWFALAHVYSGQGATVNALDALAHILDLCPDNVSAHNQRADLLWSLGAYPEAMKHTEKVLAIAPDYTPALKRLIDHRCRAGLLHDHEGQQTTTLLKKLQKLSPHAPETYQSQAYYHLYKGNPKNGKMALQRYCADHPTNPFGFCYYAQFLVHIGNIKEATDLIWRAYQLYPEHLGISQLLCETLPMAEQFQRLEQCLEPILDRFPNQWSITSTISKFLVEQRRDVERGLQLAFHSTQFHPHLAAPWFHYGQVLAHCQTYPAALEAMTTGWNNLPTQWFCASSIPAAICIAQCYDAMENLSLSRTGTGALSQRWWYEVLERSRQLMPFFPALSHYFQGTAHIGLQHPEAGSKHLHLALTQQLPYSLSIGMPQSREPSA
ncbi:MAG: tetratricopeptide repeat protein [Cyanothece sp. SIO2G6]|nr:tetratricopeptide repeat protein [Cyanothece sp. SIO2G6]